MNRLLSLVALLGLSGLGINLSAQQTPSQTPSQTPAAPDSQASPSTATPSAPSPDSAMPQAQADATNSQPSARAFEGKIQKSGSELVLEENTTETAYKLDDQDKAKKFEGKDVRVMATMDPKTNKLHVVDITRADTR
jgi:hypothetical protein